MARFACPRSQPSSTTAHAPTSLLRYLYHWRDDGDAPYAAIVLVTHSQGTVISADLLDVVQRERDPELTVTINGERRNPPLYLFTMGSMPGGELTPTSCQ